MAGDYFYIQVKLFSMIKDVYAIPRILEEVEIFDGENYWTYVHKSFAPEDWSYLSDYAIVLGSNLDAPPMETAIWMDYERVQFRAVNPKTSDYAFYRIVVDEAGNPSLKLESEIIATERDIVRLQPIK